MARSMRSQARAVLKRFLATNPQNKSKSNSISIRTHGEYAGALARIGRHLKVSRLKQITPEMANKYLAERREDLASQATLDLERGALSKLIGQKLKVVKAINVEALNSRSYNDTQINLLLKNADKRHQVAIRLAAESGLRAVEIGRMELAKNRKATSARKWDPNRFVGMDGVKYTVKGKGGLVREVMVSHSLHKELQELKVTEKVVVTDRSVKYEPKFDVPFGQRISNIFSELSKMVIGFSHGFHGLRHSYAQKRLDDIKTALHCSDEYARKVLSQELGHFRPDITKTYLR